MPPCRSGILRDRQAGAIRLFVAARGRVTQSCSGPLLGVARRRIREHQRSDSAAQNRRPPLSPRRLRKISLGRKTSRTIRLCTRDHVWPLLSGDRDDPNCVLSQFPVLLPRVAWSILDCARRTSTFLSCAFREQENGQATLSSLFSILRSVATKLPFLGETQTSC